MTEQRYPTISVVISSYNYAHYLTECIESALSQLYPALEVIVVDDGSTDNSREVIESFGDSIVAIFKANGGQTSSWNVGLSRASGEIIVLLDSDDRLEPGCLDEYARAFRPGVARCHGYMRAITAQGEPTGERIPGRRPEEGDLKETVLSFGPGSYICPPTSGNAWAAEFIKAIIPLPEKDLSGPDGFLALAAPLFGKIVTLDRETACFRLHGGSVSDNNSELTAAHMRKTLAAYERQCAWLKKIAGLKNLIAEPTIWKRKNWRIATLRYLACRMENTTNDLPGLFAHLGTVRGTRSLKSRIPLALLILAIRLAPGQQAIWLAKQKINLKYMAI